MENPPIDIFGLTILEPITSLTAVLVSIVCLYAFFQLSKLPRHDRVHHFFRYYFLSMAVATAVGGIIGHAFLYAFTFAWKLPGWITSMCSIALIERASIEHARPLIRPAVGRFFAVMNILELLTFLTVVFLTLDFFFVEAHSFYGLMIVVFSFQGYDYYRTHNEGSRYVLYAVGVMAVSALIFMNELAISRWFNHFDISHVLMAIAAWLFYQGARRLQPLQRQSDVVSRSRREAVAEKS
ncbi:MAG: hypothetical protein KDC32_14335 [Saprospiraceae bacterium]|nr:hypothetical protein [Saprospiraceae bacterium]MCB0682066.1 hypothetical protein [Saprospiraceae bacterium]